MSFLDEFPKESYGPLNKFVTSDTEEHFKTFLTDSYELFEKDPDKTDRHVLFFEKTDTLIKEVEAKSNPSVFKELLILSTRYSIMINDALNGSINIPISISKKKILIMMLEFINFMRTAFFRKINTKYTHLFYLADPSGYPDDVLKQLKQMGGRKRKSIKKKF